MSTYTARFGKVVRELKSTAVVSVNERYGDIKAPPDILIGMDVLSMSDFNFTNKGETVLTIRTPSEGDTPFVADTNEAAR